MIVGAKDLPDVFWSGAEHSAVNVPRGSVLPPMYSPFLMFCVANAPRPYSAAAISNGFVVVWSKVIHDE